MAGSTQPMFNISYDDSGWSKAFAQYLDIRKNIKPKPEIRRRAKNIGMRLITISKKSGPSKGEITTKVRGLSYRLRIRPSIRKRFPGNKDKQIEAELRARIRARAFTATGWFPAVEKLGGNPQGKVAQSAQRGPRRGRLVERLGIFEFSESLINDQPGAAQVMDRSGNGMQMAIEQEMRDMLKYIIRKQAEAARKAGLIP